MLFCCYQFMIAISINTILSQITRVNLLDLPVSLFINEIIVAHLELQDVARVEIACCSHVWRMCLGESGDASPPQPLFVGMHWRVPSAVLLRSHSMIEWLARREMKLYNFALISPYSSPISDLCLIHLSHSSDSFEEIDFNKEITDLGLTSLAPCPRYC